MRNKILKEQLKRQIKKIISENLNEDELIRQTPKYKKFVEIIKNSKTSYFTFTDKYGKKQKIELAVYGGKINKILPKGVKHGRRKWDSIPLDADLFNVMGNDLQPIKPTSHKPLSTVEVDMEDVEQKEIELENKLYKLTALVRKYGDGYYTYLNTLDNKKYRIKLFYSPNRDTVETAYYKIKPFSELIVYGEDFKPSQKQISSNSPYINKLLSTINKTKNIWVNKTHPNVWQHEVQAWKKINLDELKNILEEKLSELSNNTNKFVTWFYPWFEDKYGVPLYSRAITRTVESLAPNNIYSDKEYQAYQNNIKKHLNGRENFKYSWKNDKYHNVINVVGQTKNGQYCPELHLVSGMTHQPFLECPLLNPDLILTGGWIIR